MSPVFKKGIYEHYKGKLYEVIDSAKHSETLEEMIVYRALYDDYRLWTRPLEMFFEDIEINGVTRERFRYLGPDLKVVGI